MSGVRDVGHTEFCVYYSDVRVKLEAIDGRRMQCLVKHCGGSNSSRCKMLSRCVKGSLCKQTSKEWVRRDTSPKQLQTGLINL